MASGCPLNNLIPEWNDLVYQGKWDLAVHRLIATNRYPEFTSRVCPALCEAACTCGMATGDPVTVKENERAIVEYGYESGAIHAVPPPARTGKTVAVIGAGPAGLSVADLLNKRGHKVTIYEREDRPGGLLMYGIPNMKLEKWVIDRRVKILQDEGIEFVMNGANHRMNSVTTYPFNIMGSGWEQFTPSLEDLPLKGDTVVGNDVWIGQNVTVMPGVHIGDGSIIAANSVVTKDIPPYSIAGGNPCKLIRKRFDDDLTAYLLNLKWWDWDADKIFRNMEALCSGDLTKIKDIKD